MPIWHRTAIFQHRHASVDVNASARECVQRIRIERSAGGFESGAGLDRVKIRRFALDLAGACGGLDPVSRGTVLAFTAGRMSPGHHVNAGTTRSGGTVKARKAARDARAERLDRTRRALTAPSTASD